MSDRAFYPISGAMGAVLTHASGEGDGRIDEEHVLLLGFDQDGDPVCAAEDGVVDIRVDYIDLIIDWRYTDGKWSTLEDLAVANEPEEPADTEVKA